MTVSPRTTYARATASYDDDFRRRLIEEIITAIAKASLVTDANVMARTGEMIEALTSCMISFAAMSRHVDTPSHPREFVENTAKRIRREVSESRGLLRRLRFRRAPRGNA